MENVVREKYLRELNQLWLISSYRLDDWIRYGGDDSDARETFGEISKYVRGVESSDGCDVVLGACFTGRCRPDGWSGEGFGTIVFPVLDHKISYNFSGGDYFIRHLDELSVVYSANGLGVSHFRPFLFFERNPFENPDCCKDVRRQFLQTDRDVHDSTRARRRLVGRAVKANPPLGTPEAFLRGTFD